MSRDLGVALLELFLSIGFTIVAVRLLVINGLERLAQALGWSAKTKGQILGYATSLPELVAVLATALNGRESLAGGFWNIASSNVINLVLFLAAVVFYLRHWELLNPRFIEEISFCGFSVLLPLVLAATGVSPSLVLVVALLGCFLGYQLLDHNLAELQGKRGQESDPQVLDTDEGIAGEQTSPSQGTTLVLLLVGTVALATAGYRLGNSAELLIEAIQLPAWLVGCCLGLVTSLPELTSFFELYGRSTGQGETRKLDATQANLDTLVSSNMANIGLIYPVGLAVFQVSEWLGLDALIGA
ncbi:hypothetical protein BV61_03545 [Candidatus Synechococcus spongiarum LMB bulk15M]|uniref:Sodium/calcium exchanger membrane region domain-containing protein n=1 Tax=Candidatus Synechococcus spongiarum LMB bulk15M TaxID=1943582 RepID=A0A1T1D0D2_9SYNE|nr:hypothetical protein BV61_03545 [Candidatus Synechococcus spongiarum LMB bulk15M]